MNFEELPNMPSAREAIVQAMVDCAQSTGLNDPLVAGRLANQCFDLFLADIKALKLTGDEAIRGMRAGEISSAR